MRKICQTVLLVGMLFSIFPFAFASEITIVEQKNIVEHQNEMFFSDVPYGAWYEDAVLWAIEEQVTTGTSKTTFSPNIMCTNAEVLTFIWRACGSPIPSHQNPFVDVSEDSFYYRPAVWAYENNMVTGEKFSPNKPCTRSMAVKYLWEKAGAPQSSGNVDFTDIGPNVDYVQAVAWAIEEGITNGTSETEFSPSEICSRAQIITFLYRDVGNYSSTGSESLDIII